MNKRLIYGIKRHSIRSGILEVRTETQQGNVYRDERHRITQEAQDRNTGICTGLGRNKICENTILYTIRQGQGLMTTKFECGTKLWESWKSLGHDNSGCRDLELARICQ